MRATRNRSSWIVLFAMLGMATAGGCTSSSDGSSGSGDHSSKQPAKAVVGVAGGSVTSADGALTIDVPAGAFAFAMRGVTSLIWAAQKERESANAPVGRMSSVSSTGAGARSRSSCGLAR